MEARLGPDHSARPVPCCLHWAQRGTAEPGGGPQAFGSSAPHHAAREIGTEERKTATQEGKQGGTFVPRRSATRSSLTALRIALIITSTERLI